MRNGKVTHLIKTIIELQAMVPTKSIKQCGEAGLRQIAVMQDTEFGLENHFGKDKIDDSTIDINFGFGRLTVKKADLQEALKETEAILG